METDLQRLKDDLAEMRQIVIQLVFEITLLKSSRDVQQSMSASADRRADSLRQYQLEYERQHGNTTPIYIDSGEDEID